MSYDFYKLQCSLGSTQFFIGKFLKYRYTKVGAAINKNNFASDVQSAAQLHMNTPDVLTTYPVCHTMHCQSGKSAAGLWVVDRQWHLIFTLNIYLDAYICINLCFVFFFVFLFIHWFRERIRVCCIVICSCLSANTNFKAAKNELSLWDNYNFGKTKLFCEKQQNI